MKKSYNKIFDQFLTEYKLPKDLSFSVDLPTEVQNILSDQILITEFGITLKSFNSLYKPSKNWENQSIIEDNENHFHVDWNIEPANNQKAFMLGIKTLILLAEKFKNENIKGIRFWYSFQTPELGKFFAKKSNNNVDDEHYISDRLSFFKLRDGEYVLPTNIYEDNFFAILIIDI